MDCLPLRGAPGAELRLAAADHETCLDDDTGFQGLQVHRLEPGA